MMSIVANHCFGLDTYQFKVKTISYWTYVCDIQFVKFGTISFFLLAGFLIGDKFGDYSATEYLKRRFNNTFKPWIIWSLTFVVVIVMNKLYGEWRGDHDYKGWHEWIINAFKTVYLYSAYWFIINFLICISILLIFKKQLYSIRLGLALLVLTLFYSINVYFEWIEPLHTMALFGFVFFLWLGAQMHKHWAAIEDRVRKIPMYVFVLMTIITFLVAIFEIDHLFDIKSEEPFNSLRLSNLLYSMAFFFLLVKMKNLNFLLKLKPRETTYGIYLIHYILVYLLLPELERHVTLPHLDQMSPGLLFVYQMYRFLTAYIITYLLVIGLNKTRLKWLIGR